MKTYPQEGLREIGFETVKEMAAAYSAGKSAAEEIFQQQPSTDPKSVSSSLNAVHLIKQLLEDKVITRLSHYDTPAEWDRHLNSRHYVLDKEEAVFIYLLLEQMHSLKEDLKSQPELPNEWMEKLDFPLHLLKESEKIFDEEGEIRKTASKELAAIITRIDKKKNSLDRAFESSLEKEHKAGHLREPWETIFQGRRVFAVKPEFKNKVTGVVMSTSSSGKTYFIEPYSTVQIHNELMELELEYRKEIYKILAGISESYRSEKEKIITLAEFRTEWDIYLSKAFLAEKLNGNLPKLQSTPTLHIINAKNPLLVSRYGAINKEVIPFDLTFEKDNKILLVSGPNAGGKTVLLKTVGLLQVMVQCGYLIPAGEESKFGIFKKICIDIGDKQSIDQDLSTYSSHIMAMKIISEKADPGTLLLIDEFGGGTDPKTGGAIAEGILKEFVKKKAWGVVTTHYPNLKFFAYKNKGVVNGGMLYDKENLTPAFKLQVGRPGSSFAIEIAERMGLDNKILSYAKKAMGSKYRNIEDVIRQLEEEAELFSKQKEDLQNEKEELEKLRKQAMALRDRQKAESRSLKLRDLALKKEESTALEERLKEELKKSEMARKQKLEEVQRKRKLAEEELQSLKKEVYEEEVEDELEEGSNVMIVNSNVKGVVKEIRGERAIVMTSGIPMEVKIHDLRPAAPVKSFLKSKTITSPADKEGEIINELDMRGESVQEAKKKLEEFLDRALLNDVDRIRIIHGKGTGKLRQMVQRELKKYPVREHYHPSSSEGGDGVTILNL